MNKKFNVGNKVCITNATHPSDDYEREIAWVSSMDKFKGQTVTIKEIIEDYSFGVDEERDNYLIVEDNEEHYWSPMWFSKPISELKIFLQHLENRKEK